MIEMICMVLFFWFLGKFVKLGMKAAWCGAKIAASVLFVLALPLLAVCLIASGGLLLILPAAMLAAGFCLLKQCL